jgi:hypothetical protein
MNKLYELQCRWEVWGLVVPFLFDHTDLNVQFFGAHTAQVKVSRYTINAPIPYVCFRESFPTAHGAELVPFLLNITGHSISLSLAKVIPRKLFVAVCYLFFAPNIIHYLCSAICTCSEACAPRAFSLAQLDYGNIHGALERKRSYGIYFGLPRDCR